ncbi:hypothetical protein BURPS668_A0928 [Burkholderia pseudomallei 668]|nr:hypothetical protein BURPS668_A0928 [Burkholderia pseudomallei 668]
MAGNCNENETGYWNAKRSPGSIQRQISSIFRQFVTDARPGVICISRGGAHR